MTMKRTYFPPGQEPKVNVTTSDECAGGSCTECPGFLPLPEYGTVFCIHDCHRAANQDQ